MWEKVKCNLPAYHMVKSKANSTNIKIAMLSCTVNSIEPDQTGLMSWPYTIDTAFTNSVPADKPFPYIQQISAADDFENKVTKT